MVSEGLARTRPADRSPNLTLKASDMSTVAAVNGSNRIVPCWPLSASISLVTCPDDHYLPSCHSFASRGSVEISYKYLIVPDACLGQYAT